MPKAVAEYAAVNNANKKLHFKNRSPFTICPNNNNNNNNNNNIQDIDIVMHMYNVIEYCYISSKTSRSLWHQL